MNESNSHQPNSIFGPLSPSIHSSFNSQPSISFLFFSPASTSSLIVVKIRPQKFTRFEWFQIAKLQTKRTCSHHDIP